MLDMGFIRDIRSILALLPAAPPEPPLQRHVLERDPGLAEGLLDRPGIGPGHARATRRPSSCDQVVHPVDRERKRELLCAPGPHACRSTRRSSSPAPSTAPTGSPSSCGRTASPRPRSTATRAQPQRVRALDDFKAGRVTLLIATEVAARGLDIEQLPHVVNFELPMVPSDYVHRIGRTGRAGLEGDADLAGLRRRACRCCARSSACWARRSRARSIAGFEPDRSIRAEPIRLRTGGAGAGRAASRHPARTSPRPSAGGRTDRAPRWQRRNGRSGGSAQHGNWQRLPGERSAR